MQIGTVFATLLGALPSDWLACDGSSHLRVDYPDLYAVLDAAYIIDANTFKLPDLRGRTPIGSGAGPGLTARAVNAQGGEETHILSAAEMPSHTHQVPWGGAPAANSALGEGTWTGFSVFNTFSAGGDGAHNNMEPWTAVKYAVQAR